MKRKSVPGIFLGKMLSLPTPLGFLYFATNEPFFLFFFSFAGCLSFFILDHVNWYDPSDKRYVVASARSEQHAYHVALIFLLFSGFFAARNGTPQEFVILFSAVGWCSALFTHAFAFQKYAKIERKQ